MKVVAAAAIGVLVGLAGAMHLGTAPVAAATMQEAEAARLYQEASAAVAKREFRKAASLFERAYNYDSDPSLLMNAAGAHKADLNYKQARFRYWNVVNHPKATAAQKAEAARRMEAMAAKLRAAGKPLQNLPMPGNVVATTTTTTTTPAAKVPAGKPGVVRSGNVMRAPRPDIDDPYMLSAMHCRWDGPTGRFMQCSAKHAWGGAANFDISKARTSASTNGLTIGIQNSYKGKPYCSVEFQDIAQLRRVQPEPTAVTIWLHNGDGTPKNWDEVKTWVTVICHGVD